MMKRIIQICSALALTVVFFGAAAHAQNNRIEAKIPFDFHVGNKSYVAGDYILNVSKNSVNTVSVTLEDTFGNRLESVLLSSNGQTANGQERLVFDRVANERYLSKVLLNEKGFSLLTPNEVKDAKRETVAAFRR